LFARRRLQPGALLHGTHLEKNKREGAKEVRFEVFQQEQPGYLHEDEQR
jgi:hypothetical protein